MASRASDIEASGVESGEEGKSGSSSTHEPVSSVENKETGKSKPQNKQTKKAKQSTREPVSQAEEEEFSCKLYAVHLEGEMKEGDFVFFFEGDFGKLNKASKPVQVNTLYKRKADKVRPVNLGHTTGETPGGTDTWFEDDVAARPAKPSEKYEDWITGRFATSEPGSRLTKERFESLTIGNGLQENERDMLYHILRNREEALAFDWSHLGIIREEVTPPIKIRTVPHEAWQEKAFPIPKALATKVVQMLKERAQRGVMEWGNGPYRNKWFLVAKKEKDTYRLITAVVEMNRVTVRDANIPPGVDQFSEEFAGLTMASLIDLFSGYDQILLDLESRDMTAIQTPIGLLRMTRLPQGATNSIAQFIRVIYKILLGVIPDIALPYMDDVGVKGSRSFYNNEESLPGIRKFVLEHMQNLDKVLERFERAGATVGPKSQYCLPGLKIVGYVTDSEGRHPETTKVKKILEWKPCESVTDARAFIGVCVYYRIWIKDFSRIASPIYALMKKGAKFNWGEKQTEAMETLKKALTEAPALVKLQYGEGAGVIYLTVDASLTGWGAVLQQEDENGKRHPVRYESGLWNSAQQKYDATKRECRGAITAMKKLRGDLYGVHFILETDAAVLVAQLNGAASDLPGALLTQWIAWMRLMDFEIRHIPGTKNTAADGLSRRAPQDSDVFEQDEEDIEEFISAQLYYTRISAELDNHAMNRQFVRRSHGQKVRVLAPDYSKNHEAIARYLLSLKKPKEMSLSVFRRFKSEALNYMVHGKHLYRRPDKVNPMRLVVDDREEQQEIIKLCHLENGHRGRESTYRRVANRFFWKGCYEDCKALCLSCPNCQKRAADRMEDPMYPTWSTGIFEKVAIDVVHMPTQDGKSFMVLAKEDLSGWSEGRALAKANAEAIAKFIWEDIVCRHGLSGRLVVDGGPENKGVAEAFAKRYGIKRVQISAYNSKGNGMIERGHRDFLDGLSKATGGGFKKWPRLFHAVMFAERTSIHAPTGVSPFVVIYGREPILPLERKYPVWRLLDFNNIKSRGELLALRARQLEMRDEDIEEIVLRKRRYREAGKAAFDTRHHLRLQPIKKGDTVLVYDIQRQIDKSSDRKLDYRWLGPYQVAEADVVKGFYRLKEFDGVLLKGTFAANRLKRFIRRNKTFVSLDSGSDSEDASGSDDDSDASEYEDEAVSPLPVDPKRDFLPPKSNQFEIRPPTLSIAEKSNYQVLKS